jgi:hypothetical protein
MECQEKKDLSNSSERNKRQYFKLNGQNGITQQSNNNTISNHNSYKNGHHMKLQNGGNVMHLPRTTSNGVVGHVGLMSNSSHHARSGKHGSKIPSR